MAYILMKDGLNRNNVWMRKTTDISLIAYVDMTFFDVYTNVVLDLSNQNPKADAIILDSIENHPIRKSDKNSLNKKCGYGAAKFAIRSESVQTIRLFIGRQDIHMEKILCS